MLDHAEKIEEIISEVLANYAKENDVKIKLDSNYETETIRIQVLSQKYMHKPEAEEECSAKDRHTQHEY